MSRAIRSHSPWEFVSGSFKATNGLTGNRIDILHCWHSPSLSIQKASSNFVFQVCFFVTFGHEYIVEKNDEYDSLHGIVGY